jgi:hypothetical protein
MCGLARGCIAGVLASLVAVCAPSSQAANLLELNFYLSGPRYDGVLPPCDVALERIRADFGEKERSFWNSELVIVNFDRVRETAFRPWAPDTIPRRFCTALARTSDGAHRPVYYSIGEDAGFSGVGWGVEWCVVGVDRNWAFNPGCKMAKP